jgi:glycerophosphoryl diester phosphodiesterase
MFGGFMVLVLVAGSPNHIQGKQTKEKIVIAHRGASGYLPEHTLEAKALAYGQGADYLEQDVVMTKDDVLVVLHDHHLDTTTDVAEVYPDRHRQDGRYYVIDFTLAEIKQLQVTERIDLSTGQAVYKNRFPPGKSHFEVATLREEIEFIQGLNQSTGKRVGIYPEIKSPDFHESEGKDIAAAMITLLGEYGYKSRDDKCFVQCFHPQTLQRIRDEMGSDLSLVQLIGGTQWRQMAGQSSDRAEEVMKEISKYADGIGPDMNLIISGVGKSGKPVISDMVTLAHNYDLVVHPYTLRKDARPAWTKNYEQLLEWFYFQADVDGAFTDFPDIAVELLSGAQ